MNKYNVSINLFPFSELSEKAKQNAIFEHRQFMLSDMQPEDFITGCAEYDTPEELQKAYDSEYEYILFNDVPVIESIEINEYLFFSNGDFAPVFYKFPDGTTKSRESYIKIHGEEHRIA